jgi:hypothetical protein
MADFKDRLYEKCIEMNYDNETATNFFKSIGEKIRKLESLRKGGK